MPYSVFFSDPATTTAAGFGKVAHIPCIFDARPRYHRASSRYLIDRGLGLWQPNQTGSLSSGNLLPTPVSLKNYADWLINFLEWAELRKVDLSTCSYSEHIHGSYRKEMLEGTWSSTGTSLSPRTINLRVRQACDFLSWMVEKGMRPPFHDPGELTLPKSSPSAKAPKDSRTTFARNGKVRVAKRRMRMPTDAQLSKWLSDVEERFGYTERLMCETVLLTAIRREEAASLRVDTLPEREEEWHVSNPDAPYSEQRVLVSIKFGAKGPSYGLDHGDKIGPERTIGIPLQLAQEIHRYRKNQRVLALRIWVKSTKNIAEQRRRIKETQHLFLNQYTGERIGSKKLYNIWTGVPRPINGWSPHKARDWWACSILWKELKKHEHLVAVGTNLPAALLESSAISVIRLRIQPQLGHCHQETTLIYLQWIADMIGENVAIQYESQNEH